MASTLILIFFAVLIGVPLLFLAIGAWIGAMMWMFGVIGDVVNSVLSGGCDE